MLHRTTLSVTPSKSFRFGNHLRFQSVSPYACSALSPSIRFVASSFYSSTTTEQRQHERTSYENPLTSRYTSKEMNFNWSPQKKFSTWRRLWLALAQAQKEAGLNITDKQIAEMQAHLDNINWEVAENKERELRHDVMSHIHAFGEQCPTAKPIIHLGATSCFVGDNTDLIQMRDGLELLQKQTLHLMALLKDMALAYKDLPTLGFTHYQPAQLTTVGKRATLWLQDFLLDYQQLDYWINNMPFRGAKGTTGTQASFLELLNGDHEKVRALDRRVTELMGFTKPISVSGQTYTRKIDYFVLSVLSGMAQSAQKLATDVRLLMNLKELDEPFEKKQVGSSAMAYKRNPMRCERICALSRYVISMTANAAHTHANQWFERTLDDSANRRLSLPEAFLAMDVILRLTANVIDGIKVWPLVIRKHIDAELPFMATENILMACVKRGGDRQHLHEAIREHSMEAGRLVKEEGKDNDLLERIANDPQFDAEVRSKLSDMLEPSGFVGRAPQQVEEFIREEVDPILQKHSKLLSSSSACKRCYAGQRVKALWSLLNSPFLALRSYFSIFTLKQGANAMQGEDEDGAYVQDEGCDCDEDEPEEEVANEHYGCGILSGNRKNLPRSYYFEQTERKEGKVDEKDGLQQQQQKSWNSMDAAALEALLSQGRNWNEEYQSLMELSPPQPSNELEVNERGLHPHNRVPTKKEQERALFELERARSIQSLYREFTQTAERIAVRLIAEQFWGPDQPRTIAPITNQVGGAAGGAKYFAEGIFFKFAVDENGLYGGEDEGIMKVAGHELKSLIACLDRRVAGLHFPLVVLVDFRGRRIIAQSVLPLGKDTIIYGSNNAGKDIHASVKTFNEKMALLAREYHLCGEHISNHSKTQTVKLYSSCDVEGHRGRDGRYYLIDMARYFPPTAPNKSLKGGFLFQLLRPEFMKNYSKALLCPDSYSGFWLQNKKQHNADVVDATKYLAQVIVPGFVEQMAGQLFQHFYPTEEQGRGGETPEKNKDYGDDTKQRRDTDSAKRNTKRSGTKNKIIERDIDERLRKRHFEELVLQLHRNGINMRLLGLIRANIITQMNGEKKWKKEKRKKRKEEKVKVILQKELWDKKKEKRDEAAKSREEKERKQKTLWERKKWRLAFLNQLLTTEMVARTLKQMIKREMRQLCLDEEQRYKEVVAKHFCHLLFVLLQQLTSIAKTSKRTEERILFSTEDVQQEEMYWTRVEVEVERRFSSKATWKEKEQEKNSSKEEENKTAQNHKKANKKKKMKKQSSMAPPKIVDNILMVSLWKRLQTFLGISFCMTEEQLKEEEEQASVTSSTFLFRRMEQRPRGKNRFIFFLLNSFGKQHKNNALKFRHDEAYPFRTVCAGELINAMRMRPKVKHIHRISFEEGTALSKLASSVALSPLQSSRATASSSTFPISTSLSCPRTLLMATELAISAEESLPALRKSDDYFTLAQKQFKEAIARNPSDARSLHNWALSLYLKAASMSGKEADDLYRVSGNKFKAALSIEPYDYQAFFKWGNCLFQRHRIRQHQLRLASTPALVQCCNHESLQLLDRAIARYDRAWQLKRDDYEILFNWANAIYHKASLLLKSKQADASPSAERDLATSREETMISSPNSRQEQLAFLELDEQEDNFVPAKAMKTKSVKLHKEDDETEDCDEDESDSEEDYAAEGVQWRNIVALLKEACSKYEKAHCLQPSSFQVLRNWAVALSKKARLGRNGSKASQLYMEAFEKYKAALLLKSNDYELHFNYGNALFRYVNSLMSSAQAPTTLATQRVQLGVLGLCSEQYHQCLVLNPKCSHALKNWKDVILLKDKVLSILLEKQEEDIKQQLSLLKDELQAYLTLHLRSNKNVEMSFLSLIREFGGENLRLRELQNCFNACIKSLCFVSTSSHPTPAIQSPSLEEASDHKQALQGSTTYGGTTTIMAPNIDALQWRGDTILSPSLHPSLFHASLHI